MPVRLKFHRSSDGFVLFALLGCIVLTSGCGGGGAATTKTPAAKANPINTDPSVPQAGAFQASDGILVRRKTLALQANMTQEFSIAGVVETESINVAPDLSISVVQPAAGQTFETALAALNASPSVLYAEPNYIWSIDQVVPNDPQYPNQYFLNNTGQAGGRAGADIRAQQAWTLQTGTRVVIAVIDTGVNYNHPDLQNNIWTNTREIAGNGVDDDRNGFVDDIRGWDFANNDNNPLDDNRHGSHVSGIIAAQGNNGVGVSGVNWSAQIMPLKFMTATGSGTSANAIRAINYAVANGARISNNSWGGGAFSQALQDAITAAEGAGHLFVAAAGNASSNNDTTPSYPASYTNANILSVAATTSSDGLATFSNFGARSVDVGAPGQGILSTVLGSATATLSGTSMAAPVVAGVAGLVLAANSSLSVSALRNAILNSTDPVTALSGRTVTGGRVNAFRALQSIGTAPPSNTPPGPTPTALAVTPSGARIAAGAQILFTANGGTAPYTWSVANAAVGSINTSTGSFVGSAVGGTTAVTARDAGGATASQTIVVSALAISPNLVTVGVGASVALSVSGGTAPFTWSSANSSVAAVSSIGVVTGVGAGSTTITVRDANGISATSGTITVAATPNAVLTLSPAPTAIGLGQQISLSVSGGTAPYTWTSTLPGTLQVTPGTATTSATVQGLAVGSAAVTVRDAANLSVSTSSIAVRDIQITVGTSALLVGATTPISVAGGLAPISLASSNNAIASIDASNNLVGVSAGSITISATDADGIIAQSGTVTVSTTTSTIAITPSTISVPAGFSVQFTATGGLAPFSFTVSNSAAGVINAATGRFRASGTVGQTTSIIVTDAAGAVATSGLISVTAAPVTDDHD